MSYLNRALSRNITHQINSTRVLVVYIWVVLTCWNCFRNNKTFRLYEACVVYTVLLGVLFYYLCYDSWSIIDVKHEQEPTKMKIIRMDRYPRCVMWRRNETRVDHYVSSAENSHQNLLQTALILTNRSPSSESKPTSNSLFRTENNNQPTHDHPRSSPQEHAHANLLVLCFDSNRTRPKTRWQSGLGRSV